MLAITGSDVTVLDIFQPKMYSNKEKMCEGASTVRRAHKEKLYISG